MAGPISIQCPQCQAKLKLKSESTVGKRVSCPKCKTPFVVELPVPEDDDFLGDLEVGEEDYGTEDGEFEDAAAVPTPPRRRRVPPPKTSRKKNTTKRANREAGGASWRKPDEMAHHGHNSRALFYILMAVCGLFGGLVTIVGG